MIEAAARNGIALLTGPVSHVALRPWLDRLLLVGLTDVALPLLRGNAAALTAEGDRAAFLEEAGGRAPDAGPWLDRVLSDLRSCKQAYQESEARWRDIRFAGRDPGEAALVRAERERRRAAIALFHRDPRFLRYCRGLPPVKWSVIPPEEAESAHGKRLADPENAFGTPDPLPEARRSWPLRRGRRRGFTLRYPSPRMGDAGWARVSEPADRPIRGTVIFLHGIAVESELWPELPEALGRLREDGFRLIHPEAPWHGRRRLAGYYGGEPALARGPLGFAQLFEALVEECACLIAWARARDEGPVAIAGLSLGALAGQLVASVSVGWPRDLRPDAALLVATSASLSEVATSGSLARRLGLWDRLVQAGWDEAGLRHWAPLVEPRQEPAVDPGKIVMVLGARDTLTPFSSGVELARRWQVPEPNLFVKPQGHFTVGLAFCARGGPLDRLAQVLEDVR